MTTNQDELKEWATSMTEPAGFYDEKNDDDIELGNTPTVDELRKALNSTRAEVGLALDVIHGSLEKIEKDLDKLRNHRHDNSKQFGGRPEF
jgi:hypothetical protein